MIDHVSVGTTDLARAITFYDAVLSPLGAVRVWTSKTGAGYGPPGAEDKLAVKEFADACAAGSGLHIALTASTRAAVDAFFAAALSHGGEDIGPPGLRPKFGAGYYAAFVEDPDGNHLEAVCHEGAKA